MKCVRGYEIEILRSGMGYYRGTRNDEGFPNCRLSQQYARDIDEAENLPLNRQHCLENSYCNGGCGCFCKVNNY